MANDNKGESVQQPKGDTAVADAVLFLLTSLRSDAVQGVSSADVNAINAHIAKLTKQ